MNGVWRNSRLQDPATFGRDRTPPIAVALARSREAHYMGLESDRDHILAFARGDRPGGFRHYPLVRRWCSARNGCQRHLSPSARPYRCHA